jgi:tetratricopeptide (TPR) repeat protein
MALAVLLAAVGCKHVPEAPPPTPREQAIRSIDSGEPALAIPILEQLGAKDPSDLEIARLLAEAYVKAGRADELLSRFEAGEASAPVQYMRGLVLFAKAADATPAAVEAMKKAIALAPSAAELHYRLGLMLLESEKYAAALEPLERAAELDPKRPAFLLPLAKARTEAGNAQGAVEALRKLVELGPTPAQVKTARALMAMVSDPYTRVPKAAQPKIDEAIDWLHAYDVPQQAIVTLESLLRDFPDLAIAHALLGLAYQKVDDAGRAVDELRRAIELVPDHGRFHLYLADLYLGRQRPDQAKGEYEKAAALDPLLDEAYARLGDLAFERRDIPVAKQNYRILSSLRPDAAGPHAKLAIVCQVEGDLAAADAGFRRALEILPEDVELQLRMGLLQVERHKAAKTRAEKDAARKEAQTWLSKVLQAQPENALASRALESLHE